MLPFLLLLSSRHSHVAARALQLLVLIELWDAEGSVLLLGSTPLFQGVITSFSEGGRDQQDPF